MIWLRRAGRGERAVLIVALGVALGLLGEYIISSLNPPIGWVGYAPLSQATLSGSVPQWADYFVLLGITALWATLSIAILRAGRGHPPGSTDPLPKA